jgi:hypothetical protein
MAAMRRILDRHVSTTQKRPARPERGYLLFYAQKKKRVKYVARQIRQYAQAPNGAAFYQVPTQQ